MRKECTVAVGEKSKGSIENAPAPRVSASSRSSRLPERFRYSPRTQLANPWPFLVGWPKGFQLLDPARIRADRREVSRGGDTRDAVCLTPPGGRCTVIRKVTGMLRAWIFLGGFLIG